ncbi:MAG: bifunctional aspartate kinase/homoserine dehydrogenase I, partial [Melioribacteraceae bacterium]|nr:bifunctional aspartate kinase/homoserine dehydrogenase I [Melioribacteraceae bacterium]
FGERLSCTIITSTMQNRGIKTEYLQASELVKTDDNFGNASVNYTLTNKNISDYFKKHNRTQIITGFIGSTKDGVITTLGRGGSDYTASIFGAALNASEIQIWTDVDGILTADPRKVKNSFSLKAVTYEEAMELSHFGAKVIYPPTMQPALKKKIKIRIKNTFNPSFPGTVIVEREKSVPFNIKGISSIDNVSLVRVQGSGMIGVTGVAAKLFKSLAEKNINIILISQASSEHSICFAVHPSVGSVAKEAIETEFGTEIKSGNISKVVVEDNLSIIAVVGEDMKQTPGISGMVFQALGKNGINLHAIAQGSSELNISLVIDKACLPKALNVLHDSIFLAKKKVINLFIAGPGMVGRELLNLIEDRKEFISREAHAELKLVGVINSSKMFLDSDGFEISTWKDQLENSENLSDTQLFIQKMKALNLPNSIFIDSTASRIFIPFYKNILESSISIVTPNKIANSSRYKDFYDLSQTSKKHQVQFRYGTNVGAALPIINTLKDLVQNGDEIFKIEGVFSGTLSYIFNSIKIDSKFSDIVKEAKKAGFTEPDPRDDLSGLDVARKLLILIRESKYPFEMKDVKVESLVSAKAKKAASIDEYFEILESEDEKFSKRIKEVITENKKLCYIAKFEKGKAEVGIQEIDSRHPFYNLEGSDNIVAFTTKNFNDKPLVIKGPGAGPINTAFGVLVDILRISNYLG